MLSEVRASLQLVPLEVAKTDRCHSTKGTTPGSCSSPTRATRRVSTSMLARRRGSRSRTSAIGGSDASAFRMNGRAVHTKDACARAASRRPCRKTASALGDESDDRLEVTNHPMFRDADHTPPELVERALPRAIVTRAHGVVPAVDLDDEPHLGAREVDNVLPDDELTTKRKPGLRPRSAPPPFARSRAGRRLRTDKGEAAGEAGEVNERQSRASAVAGTLRTARHGERARDNLELLPALVDGAAERDPRVTPGRPPSCRWRCCHPSRGEPRAAPRSGRSVPPSTESRPARPA